MPDPKQRCRSITDVVATPRSRTGPPSVGLGPDALDGLAAATPRKRPPKRDQDWTGHPVRYRADDQTWVVGVVDSDDGCRIAFTDDRGDTWPDVDRARCEALRAPDPIPSPYEGEPDHVLEIPPDAARPITRWLKRGVATSRPRSEVLWRSVRPTGVDGLVFVLTCFNKRGCEESRASLTVVVYRESDAKNTSACEPLYEPRGRRLRYVAGVRKLVEVRIEGEGPVTSFPE